MKKILIVEDTEANLLAAKQFFATVSGFEFVFAKNRKEAEDLLPSVDGLITDRHMPYLETDTMADYVFVEREGELANVLKSHGYILLAETAKLEIPGVMVSDHGDLMVMKIKDQEVAKEIAQDVEMLSPYSSESYERGFDMNQNYTCEWYNIPKTDQRAWRLAWEELEVQLK